MAKFVKGQSGNPAGRPPLTETQRQAKAIAKELAGEAMDTLAKWMRDDKNAAAAVKACEAILDRADGKPKQEIEHSGQTTQYVIGAKAERPTAEAWQKQHHSNGHDKSSSGLHSQDNKPS